MTVTWIDTPGKKLSTSHEALDFLTERDVSFISVRYTARPGERLVQRSAETVYLDGVFLWPFLRSTRVGNVFSVVREGGWPGHPLPHVEEKTPVVAPAGYQPNTDGPVGLWRMNAVTTFETDLSASGMNLSSTQTTMADLVFGQQCLYQASTTGSGTPYPSANPCDLTGAMTVAWRMFVKETGFVAHMTSGTWRILVSSGQLSYTNNQGASYSAPPSMLTGPAWVWCAFRRAANGVATFNVNKLQASSGALPLPTAGGAGGQIRFTVDNGITMYRIGIADVGVWPFRMSDAQVEARRVIMTGIA
jgi:hypothetical protein